MSLVTNLQDLTTRVASEFKALRTLVNGNSSNLSALTTTTKTNLVAAINELDAAVKAAASSGGAVINDSAVSGSTTWSSSKIDSTIDLDVQAAVSALIGGAPAALDTLKELADALAAAEESSEIEAIVVALDNRVRFDAAQTLTGPQQAQARSNIGAGTSNLVIGTGAGDAKAGNYQPSAANITDATVTGRAVLTATDAAAARTAIGAGTSSLALGTTAGTAAEGNDSRIVNAVPNTRTVAGKALTANVTLVASDVGALPNTYTPPVATGAVSGTVTLAGDLAGTGSSAATPRVVSASETVPGKVELATVAEATTGTDTVRAVTPAGLKAVADTKAATSHTHTASQISDASAFGISLIKAADAPAARTLLGAASSVDVGDTNTNFVTVFEAGLV